MTHILRYSLLALALAMPVACGRKGEPPSPEAGRHQEEGAHEGEPVHLPLKEVRGLRFLVVPDPRTEGAWVSRGGHRRRSPPRPTRAPAEPAEPTASAISISP